MKVVLLEDIVIYILGIRVGLKTLVDIIILDFINEKNLIYGTSLKMNQIENI
jgi:hypothetical protein